MAEHATAEATAADRKLIEQEHIAAFPRPAA